MHIKRRWSSGISSAWLVRVVIIASGRWAVTIVTIVTVTMVTVVTVTIVTVVTATVVTGTVVTVLLPGSFRFPLLYSFFVFFLFSQS